MTDPSPPALVVRKIDIDTLGVSGIADFGRLDLTVGERPVSFRLGAEHVARFRALGHIVAMEVLRDLIAEAETVAADFLPEPTPDE